MIKKLLLLLFIPFVCFGATVQNVTERASDNLGNTAGTHYRTFLGTGISGGKTTEFFVEELCPAGFSLTNFQAI